MANGNMAAISRGEFGAVAVPRILALLERHGIPATFFVPGHTALAYPELVREIRDAGHEIGHHGFVHEPLSAARRPSASARSSGAVSTRSSRSPACGRSATARRTSTSASTRSTSCSSTASSTTPRSRAATSSRTTCGTATAFPPDGEYEFGETVDLVGIPFSWGLSDFQYFEFVPGITVRQDTPSAVYEIWHGELDWAHANVPGGVYDLTHAPAGDRPRPPARRWSSG